MNLNGFVFIGFSSLSSYFILWGSTGKGPLELRPENISALNLHKWQVKSFTKGIRVSISLLPRMHLFFHSKF
jgi:hypothetical protein